MVSDFEVTSVCERGEGLGEKPHRRTFEGLIESEKGSPKTPAEFPINVPRLVTELRMLLILKRLFETASGRKAPSLKPHNPPTPRPASRETCAQYHRNKACRQNV